METFVQALIVAFREGLEAFLIIAILLKFLDKTDNKNIKKSVWNGTYVGILGSLVVGVILMKIASIAGTAELWESVTSFIAVILITTFIVWMIKHGETIKHHIENKAAMNLTKKGVFLLAMFMVLREGAEIAVFAFAGKYSPMPIMLGVALAAGVAVLVHHSIVSLKLKTLFIITLAYLILQAGFLFGYSIHEGLEALEGMHIISEESPLMVKAFDLSGTPFNSKDGVVGLPLYIALGWYSKPEWLQFAVQYLYTVLFFLYWHKRRSSK